MKWKNRDVFVLRPLDDERVVIQEVLTGNTEHVAKKDIEGYNEDPNSKEVKLGQAPNKGDQDKDAYRADTKADQKAAEQRAKQQLDTEKAELEGRTNNFQVTSEPFYNRTPAEERHVKSASETARPSVTSPTKK